MADFYFVVACVMFAVFGLCVGSFLNVVIYRLPLGMNLSKPSSHCPVCGNKIAWYDNIPLLSYILLGAKCRHCKTWISPRYFCVELINAILWLACPLFFYEQGILLCVVYALAFSVLMCIALCDADNLFIPDSLQLCLLVLAFVAVFADFDNIPLKFWGFVAGGGFFLFFYLMSFVLFGKEGLGFGDVKLMACAGLLIGWQAIIISVVVAVFFALLSIIVSKACVRETPATQDTSVEYPFAPFLVCGIVFAMFFAPAVVEWYSQFII